MRRAACFTMLCMLAMAPCRAARAGDGPDPASVINALRGEGDAARRQQLVRQLLAIGGPRAAEALGRLVLEDPAAGVRIEAARALGLIRAEKVVPLLLDLARRGGPRAVRAAVARAIERRDGGLEGLRAALESPREDPGDRALLLGGLAWCSTAASRELLVPFVTAEDLLLRGVALHALAERTGDEAARRTLVAEALARGRTPDELMPALGAAAAVLHPSLRAAVARVATFLELPVREAALHLLDLLDAMPPEAPAPAGNGAGPAPAPDGADGRYARPVQPPPRDGPPPPPTTRGQADTIYVVDVTGSTVLMLDGLKARILRDMDVQVEAGLDARVGVLLYRGGRSGTKRAFEGLAPTWDRGRLRAWLETVEAHGVDDRGARVGAALDAALARTPWRWTARRTVHLYADGPCGDVDVARRSVGVHFRADRTRTRVTYVLRTRRHVPAEYAELAVLGGTGAPEALE